MKKLLAFGLAAAVAAGSMAATAGSASADPYWKHKHYHHGYNGGFFVPFLFGSMFGYGLGTYYGPGPYYGGGYSAHVRWCLDHYRTYNPHTNTYFIRVGVPAVCHSPFN